MSKLYNSTCYCTNLRRSANAMSEFYDSALKEAELTISQYYLLVNLSRLGKANITHWSEQVGLDRSTMVRNIKPLQSRQKAMERPSPCRRKAGTPWIQRRSSGSRCRKRWNNSWEKRTPMPSCGSAAGCRI